MTTPTFARPRRGLRLATLCAALAAAGVLPLAPRAHAERIAWQGNRFEYVADRKDLKDVLRDFGASQHVMTWISPQVEGNVTGRFSSTPQQFLEKMSASFGVLWYYNGAVLRIYGANEARSATLGLTHVGAAELRQALARLQIDDPRFPVRYDDVSRTAVVSGPPRLVDLVTDVARLIDHAPPATGTEVVVQRFPLRFASANDRTVTVNGHGVTVRGVASLLRGLYGQGGAAPDNSPARRDTNRVPSVREAQDDGVGGVGRMAGNRPPPLPMMAGLGGAALAGAGQAAVAPAAPLPLRADDEPVRARAAPAQAGPSIEADPRGNAILVRDRAENMAAYGTLIESLDMRPGVLEIDATIIEISDDALHELGVDWRLHSSRIDLQTGNGQAAQASNPGSLDPNGFGILANSGALATTPSGGVLTTVIGGAGRYLLSRISALQQNNRARITANPKVETLDNVEALMDSKQTFYVQVAGYQAADLFSVSAGVSLRVLPSIVTSAGGARQIRMDVHIEDGKLTGASVGQMPVVSNSTIDTQALINDGESLLIAGYSVNSDEHSETSVPVLSKLPVIGGMFRYKKEQGQHYQRLFLLTPRVLTPAVGGVEAKVGSTGRETAEAIALALAGQGAEPVWPAPAQSPVAPPAAQTMVVPPVAPPTQSAAAQQQSDKLPDAPLALRSARSACRTRKAASQFPPAL